MMNINRERANKIIRYFWRALGGLTLLILIYIFWVGYTLPSFEELENRETNLASEIYSADGKLIGKFFEENRSMIHYDEISSNVINALIATEDVRFSKHSGVDLKGIFGAAVSHLRGKSRGGSTITQQLARNLYQRVGKRRTMDRKLREAIAAILLEKNYTKEEIITMYLNTVEFSDNSFGIKSAARTFFNTIPDSLKIEQSATLVGMLKAPTLYNPVRNPNNALLRRNTIINQMKKYKLLDTDKKKNDAVADSLKNLPLVVSYQVESQNYGLAPYFREYLRQWMKYWCKENGYNLYTDGLKIYTTIDSRMQRYAEEAMKEHLSELQKEFTKQLQGREPWKRDTMILYLAYKRSDRYRHERAMGFDEASIRRSFDARTQMKIFSWEGEIDTTMTPWDSLKYYAQILQGGFISIDPATGFIKAWTGGINYKHFKYDHVYLGKRQVGSTFKPFLYTAAIDNGYSPCMEVLDQPIFFYKPDGSLLWAPQNAEGTSEGKVTLKRALAHSINRVSAYLIQQIGEQTVADYAYRMGIQSKLDVVPSLALGTTDLNVYELTGAYCTFANKGIWTEPIFVTRIEDQYGNVLQEFFPKTREALSEETAYIMTRMLMGVLDEKGGTATRLRFKYGFKNEIGGKTGTTQDNSDGWFVGITPELVSGCWVGCDDRQVRFRSTMYGQGANTGLPIFGLYMQKVYNDKTLNIPQDPFEKPKGKLPVELDCSKYKSDSTDVEQKIKSKFDVQ